MLDWVCNLRTLGISNFIIAAFDPELYEFALVQGLPVYYENSIDHVIEPSIISDASYGSSAFKKLTKMKSRVVLRFLKFGVNVLWSDCDVIWFRNPLPDLWSYNKHLVIQTNAPDGEAMNSKRFLNSGFYLDHSNPFTVRAFEAIVLYASNSKLSEQPCFYDVLCGQNGDRREGENMCRYYTLRILTFGP
eukprot:Plantae.Rhodophyta-Palmaria_palmata.ctg4148.p1 GENE.Plantae.Rhodophyta-Palmaria_palmata.ctg4148~~Plantae.Rhodophyta-Palmaria_palmata.ctg4148.p1  ORF type:complete len:190 (-),score=5.70 Plantae.Rhodophyta-Palmaria_palmata.ctg4148:606-1175(-)